MSNLPRGCQTKIAKQLNVSRQFVSQVLAGQKISSAVLDLAAAYTTHAREVSERKAFKAALHMMRKARLVELLMNYYDAG